METEYHALKLTDLQAELLFDRLFFLANAHDWDLEDMEYDRDALEKLVDRCPKFAGTFYVYKNEVQTVIDEVESLRDQFDDPWEAHRPGAVRSLDNLMKKLRAI